MGEIGQKRKRGGGRCWIFLNQSLVCEKIIRAQEKLRYI